jgi:protein-S-isoprenylcysteine O-methyltransferase Ste14
MNATAPWEFRFRGYVSFLAYAIGFFLGYPLSFALGGRGVPTFIAVGQHLGAHGVQIAAWVAALLTCAGFGLRWWGSSYHRAGVVFSSRIETGSLTAGGPYRYTRNPLYLGNILQAIGIGFLAPPPGTVLVVVLMTAFVYRLIMLEEHYLRTAWGQSYVAYCNAVPRLLPRAGGSRPQPGGDAPDFLRGFVTELGTFGFAIAMLYVAIALPRAFSGTLAALFYAAFALFVIGGYLNRRLS